MCCLTSLELESCPFFLDGTFRWRTKMLLLLFRIKRVFLVKTLNDLSISFTSSKERYKYFLLHDFTSGVYQNKKKYFAQDSFGFPALILCSKWLNFYREVQEILSQDYYNNLGLDLIDRSNRIMWLYPIISEKKICTIIMILSPP